MLGETWEWQWPMHEWLLEFTKPKEDYMVEFINSLDRIELHEYMVEFFKSCMHLHAMRLEAAMQVQAYMLDNPDANSVPITFIEGKIALPDIAPAADVAEEAITAADPTRQENILASYYSRRMNW